MRDNSKNTDELSNEDLVSLFSLALKHLRPESTHDHPLFDLFDELFTDRLQGITSDQFALLMDTIAEHNQLC